MVGTSLCPRSDPTADGWSAPVRRGRADRVWDSSALRSRPATQPSHPLSKNGDEQPRAGVGVSPAQTDAARSACLLASAANGPPSGPASGAGAHLPRSRQPPRPRGRPAPGAPCSAPALAWPAGADRSCRCGTLRGHLAGFLVLGPCLLQPLSATAVTVRELERALSRSHSKAVDEAGRPRYVARLDGPEAAVALTLLRACDQVAEVSLAIPGPGTTRAAVRLSRRWQRPRPTIVLWTRRPWGMSGARSRGTARDNSGTQRTVVLQP